MEVSLKRLRDFICRHLSPGGYYMIVRIADIPTIVKERSFEGRLVGFGITEMEGDIAQVLANIPDPKTMCVLFAEANSVERHGPDVICQFFALSYLTNESLYKIAEGLVWKTAAYYIGGEMVDDGKNLMPENFVPFYDFFIEQLAEEGMFIAKMKR